MAAPYRVKCASPGTSTPDKLTLVLALGHQCMTCAAVSSGDDSTADVVEYDCPHCGDTSAATRLWLARTANPLDVRAQLNLMVYEIQQQHVVKKLDFSNHLLLSPVKGARSDFGDLRSTDTVVTATICLNPRCRLAQPILLSSESQRQCTRSAKGRYDQTSSAAVQSSESHAGSRKARANSRRPELSLPQPVPSELPQSTHQRLSTPVGSTFRAAG